MFIAYYTSNIFYMKRLANILRGVFLFTAITSSVILLKSCDKQEKCRDEGCAHGGTCIEGTCNCVYPYTGIYCETEIRSEYYGTYKGSGADTKGFSYPNWTVKFDRLGDDASMMEMTMYDSSSNETFKFDVTLSQDGGGDPKFEAAPYTRTNVNETVSGTGRILIDAISFSLYVDRPGSPQGHIRFERMEKIN